MSQFRESGTRTTLGSYFHNPDLRVAGRLDYDSEGLLLLTCDGRLVQRITHPRFTLEKTYWALIKNPPPSSSGTLTHWLERNPGQNKSYAHDKETAGRKQAVLSYHLVKQLDRYSLLEINLETGRHHQIRAQLAALGCPIKGDLKYGYPRSNPNGSIHLHARQLEFIHPVKQTPVNIIAPPPEDVLWAACEDPVK